MTTSYFRALATRCRTASCDSFDLRAKEEFRQLATEFTTKATSWRTRLHAALRRARGGQNAVVPSGRERVGALLVNRRPAGVARRVLTRRGDEIPGDPHVGSGPSCAMRDDDCGPLHQLRLRQTWSPPWPLITC
jgi:hypothetical protein